MRSERLAKLGAAVEQRRRRLGLSVPGAAKLAEIDRETWRNLEAGTRQIRTYNHAAVERVLRWDFGSVEAILNGGEPTEVELAEIAAMAPAPDADRYRYTDPVTGEEYTDPDEQEIWSTSLPEGERRAWIHHRRWVLGGAPGPDGPESRRPAEGRQEPDQRQRAA